MGQKNEFLTLPENQGGDDMKWLKYIFMIVMLFFLYACDKNTETIQHDITTDDYFFDIELDKETITGFSDSIKVDVKMIVRNQKNLLFTETNEGIEDSIIQARFVHEQNQFGKNFHILYSDDIQEPTEHNPMWIKLEVDEVLEKSFTFTRIHPTVYFPLIGPSGTYDLELAVYEGEELGENDWIRTEKSIIIERKDVSDELINHEKGTFSIDIDETTFRDELITIIDIRFTASANLNISLSNTYYEHDSAIIQAEYVLGSNPLKKLYDQFPSMVSPMIYNIDIEKNSSLEKVYLFSPMNLSSEFSHTEIGVYKLLIALYQGPDLTESDWIDTGITYEYDVQE